MKQLKKKRKIFTKKRLILIVLPITLLIIGVFATVFAYFHTMPSVEIEQNFTFEYGNQIELTVSDILSGDDNIVETATLDLSNIENESDKDFPAVGIYEAILNYRIRFHNREAIIIIEIEDTTPPVFTRYREVFNLTVDDDKPNFEQYFEAEDLSDFTITIDYSEVNFEEAGSYYIKVTAKDIHGNKNEREVRVNIRPAPPVITSPSPMPSRGPTPFTVTRPTVVDGIIIVNKRHPLPRNFNPGVNQTALAALRRLQSEAQTLGLNIGNHFSGFRSFDHQARIYNNFVRQHGRARADRSVARPGFSEHQTGLAFDVTHRNGALVRGGAEARWLAANAHRFGFIVRYPAGREHITGFMHEPWHLRFIGQRATDIFNSGKTLEEFLGVPGGDYL